MRKLTYFAIFEPNNDGGYGVYFPDLPGCISCGQNFVEAEQMAKEALGLHLYGLEKDNEACPTAHEPEQLDIDTETATGYMIVPIAVYPGMVRNELDNRAVKTNLTIPAWLKELAEEQHVNYSQVLTTALKEYLNV